MQEVKITQVKMSGIADPYQLFFLLFFIFFNVYFQNKQKKVLKEPEGNVSLAWFLSAEREDRNSSARLM